LSSLTVSLAVIISYIVSQNKNEIRRVWNHFKDIFGFGYALWRIFEVTFMIQYYGAMCGYNTASNVGIATHGEKEGV